MSDAEAEPIFNSSGLGEAADWRRSSAVVGGERRCARREN